MQSTKALSSLKSVFTQPLPLDQRSSQKLLKTLTTSFRAQLDREHGWTPDAPQAISDVAPRISYLPSTSNSSPKAAAANKNAAASTYTRPTDRHLHAILDNPLFRYHEASRLPVKNLGQAGTDPKTIFEIAVAKGIMTIPRAHGFLLKIKENIQQSAAPSIRKGMGESGAGILVLKWLRASGQERNLSFIDNHSFTQLLLRFMVAEGVDDLAWVWMERLASLESANLCTTPASMLLAALVRSKYVDTVDLDGAYKLMLQGDTLFRKNDIPPSHLMNAWKALAWETTGRSWRHALPDQRTYEAFLHILAPCLPLKMHYAHLELYHPNKPSSEGAIEYLEDEHIWRAKYGDVSRPQVVSRFGEMLTSLALDTVQHLTAIGNVAHAHQIFSRIQPYLTHIVKQDDLQQYRSVC